MSSSLMAVITAIAKKDDCRLPTFGKHKKCGVVLKKEELIIVGLLFLLIFAT